MAEAENLEPLSRLVLSSVFLTYTIMITIKNVNRCGSHAHLRSKRRDLAQHARVYIDIILEGIYITLSATQSALQLNYTQKLYRET